MQEATQRIDFSVTFKGRDAKEVNIKIAAAMDFFNHQGSDYKITGTDIEGTACQNLT